MNSVLIIIFIVSLNILVYFRTLSFNIVIDDIQRRRELGTKDWKEKFSLVNLKHKLYGAGMFKDLRLDHATTLFFHILASICVFLCFGATLISFLASLLYSIHPINNQTAIWMNGRRYIVNAILIMLIWSLKPFGIILYLLTPYFQATAFPTPLLYLMTPYWYCIFLLPFFPFLGNKAILNKIESRTKVTKSKASSIAKKENLKFKFKKIILVIKTFGHYFWHLLIPIEVAFYNTKFQMLSLSRDGTRECYKFNREFWTGIGAIAITALAFIFVPPIRFYLFWFVIFIAQWCNFVTITQVVADRYTSVAIIGFLLALSHLLISCPLLVGLLAGYYLVKNFQVQRMYSNLDEFYLYHLYHVPHNVLGALFYANACLRGGLYLHAFVAVRKTLDSHPNDYRVLIVMAKTFQAIGLYNEANGILDRAELAVPNFMYMPKDKLYKIVNDLRANDVVK